MYNIVYKREVNFGMQLIGVLALNKCVTAIIDVLIKNNLVTKEEFMDLVKDNCDNITQEEVVEVLKLVEERIDKK